MAKNFDELIEQKRTQLDGIKQQMETVRQKFIQDTATVLAEWFPQKAKYILQNDADRSLKLEDIQVEQIKIRVKKLVEEAPSIADKFLSNPKIWWHLSEDSDLYYGYSGNRAPDHIDKAVRLCLGMLAPILEEYGYLENQHGRGDLYSWREWDRSGNRKIPNSRPYFPEGFDWSQEMKNTMNLYSEKMSEAIKVVDEITSLEAEKKRTQVSDRWDAI